MSSGEDDDLFGYGYYGDDGGDDANGSLDEEGGIEGEEGEKEVSALQQVLCYNFRSTDLSRSGPHVVTKI